MAYYLVEAAAKEARLPELGNRLEKEEFLSMRPFGPSVTFSLRGARRRPDGGVVWEEEDYCSPPLAQERAAVQYVSIVNVTYVDIPDCSRNGTADQLLFQWLPSCNKTCNSTGERPPAQNR